MSEISEHQLSVLRYVAGCPNGRAVAHLFNHYCGGARTVRSMFAKGLVEGDGIPAAYVTISDAGRAAIAAAKAQP